jgi:hypothetical protein
MKIIGDNAIMSFIDDSHIMSEVSNKEIRRSRGTSVNSYFDLVAKIAELQFSNSDYFLLFRGQSEDFRDKRRESTLKPPLFRSINNPKLVPTTDTLIRRFDRLKLAGKELVRLYSDGELCGNDRVQRQKILHWAILQHYEVCRTPLLDVTHSLRIAISFASLDDPKEAFVYVLGVPNLGGAITASAEAGLQIVRLSSACPPTAIRPHIQEGYLLGEYPELADYGQKELYRHSEIDFGRRLIAKFRFIPEKLRSDPSFPNLERDALYPNSVDPLFQLVKRVKDSLNTGVN